MKNRAYFEQYQAAVKEIMEMAKSVDVEDENAAMEIEKLKILEKIVKQGNNTYKNALMHEIAKARFDNYNNSFLNDDPPKLPAQSGEEK
jgi:hypothetical protein